MHDVHGPSRQPLRRLSVADDDQDVHWFRRLRRRRENGAVLYEDRRRAESFGANAEQYDRARPTYPGELIDALVADRPRRVLDVGCGTGIASRLFAERGCEVVGVEADARMADVAGSYGLHVEVAKFEEWNARERLFDLLISGQAWHWVDPSVGPRKAADVLRVGGRFGAFWNLGEHEPVTFEALAAVYQRLSIDIHDSVPLGTYGRDAGAGTAAGLEATGRFAELEVRKYFWDHRYSRDEWLDQLQTHSDHRVLPPDVLQEVLTGVSRAIDVLGGSIVVHYDTMLVTAIRIAD
jgi:SAM-dependent methyltransferase